MSYNVQQCRTQTRKSHARVFLTFYPFLAEKVTLFFMKMTICGVILCYNENDYL